MPECARTRDRLLLLGLSARSDRREGVLTPVEVGTTAFQPAVSRGPTPGAGPRVALLTASNNVLENKIPAETNPLINMSELRVPVKMALC